MLNVPGTFAGIDHLIMRLPDRSNNRHNPLPSACRTHDVLDAAAAVAAERLTALAQSSKAIENARQVPQDRRISLAGLACRPRDESGGSGGGGAPANALKKCFPSAGSLAAAGGSTAAADGSNDSGGSGSAGGGSNGAGGDPPAADTPFTEADLPNLTVCTRPNGARVVLGGGGGGSAGEVRQRRGLVYSTVVSPTILQRRHCACWTRTLLPVPTCLSYEAERPPSALADSESSTCDTLKP